MMGIDWASIHRIGRQTIRSENTPYGEVATGSNRIQRTGSGSAWAYNATGYELYDGYIVAVTGYDPVTTAYTIARPTADSMPNVAVVTSSYCANSSTARVEITFSGDVFLRYSGTAPTVANTVGSGSSSFNAKIGATGFAPLELGADGRCRARFFNAAPSNTQSFAFGSSWITSQILFTDQTSYTGSWNNLYNSSFSVDQSTTYFINVDDGYALKLVTTCSGVYGAIDSFTCLIEFGNSSSSVILTAKACPQSTGGGTLTASGDVVGEVMYGSTLVPAYSFGALSSSSISDNVVTKWRFSITASKPTFGGNEFTVIQFGDTATITKK